MFGPDTKFLVVDDMMTMRKMVANQLKKMGYNNYVEAKDGNEAWTILSESQVPFGFVISDWNMPNCTGLEFLKKCRADARFKSLPFMLVTAEAEQKQIVAAIQAGVSNYVVKPFTPQVLQGKIEEGYKKIAA